MTIVKKYGPVGMPGRHGGPGLYPDRSSSWKCCAGSVDMERRKRPGWSLPSGEPAAWCGDPGTGGSASGISPLKRIGQMSSDVFHGLFTRSARDPLRTAPKGNTNQRFHNTMIRGPSRSPGSPGRRRLLLACMLMRRESVLLPSGPWNRVEAEEIRFPTVASDALDHHAEELGRPCRPRRVCWMRLTDGESAAAGLGDFELNSLATGFRIRRVYRTFASGFG